MTPKLLFKKYGIRAQRILFHSSLLMGIGYLIVIFDLLLPMMSKLLYDFVYKNKQFDILNIAIFVTVVFLCCQFILKSLYDFLSLYTCQVVSIRLKNQAFEHIQELETRVFHNQSKGELTVKLTDDIERTVDLLVLQKLDLLFQIGQVVGTLTFCLWINSEAAIVIALCIPFYLLSSRYILKTELGIVRDRLTDLKSYVYESLQSIFKQFSVVRTFRTERKEEEFYNQLLRRQASLAIQDRILKTIFSINGQLGFDLWQVLVNWYLGVSLIQEKMSVGDLIALLMLSAHLRQPLLGLSQQFGRYRADMASLKRIHALLTLKTEQNKLSNSNSSTIENEWSSGHSKIIPIEIRGLSFQYSSPQKTVFSGIDLQLGALETYIAIVGDNGSGKSTLIQILNGNQDQYEGQVFIHGKELRDYSKEELRNTVISITSEHSVFPRTIRENIAYGNPNATDDQIIQAAQHVGIWDLIQKFPDGLNTLLRAETEISRSEKHKIAIARALLLKPKILILDDVTTDLDLLSDYLVQQHFRELAKTMTIISIANNLSTLRNSQQIVFFKTGRVAEQGNFDQLLKNRKEFYRYYIEIYGSFPEFKKMLDHEIQRNRRHGTPYSVAVFTISNFDLLIQSLDSESMHFLESEIIFAWNQTSRDTDSVTQYQKGIYLLIFPELKENMIPDCINRLEKVMSDRHFHILDQDYQFSFHGQALAFDEIHRKAISAEDAIIQVLNQLNAPYLNKQVA